MKISQIIRENSNTIDIHYRPSDHILDQIEVSEPEYRDMLKKYWGRTRDYTTEAVAPNAIDPLVDVYKINTSPDWNESAFLRSDYDGEFFLVYTGHRATLAIIHHVNKNIDLRIRFENNL